MGRVGRGWLPLVAVLLLARPVPSAADVILDEFEGLSGWSTTASDGALVEIAQDEGRTGMAMRIDFDIGSGGYVIARKAFPITLPANYTFTFWLRGEAAVNNLEFKLVDRTGQNVWWYKQRSFNFPSDWRQITIKKPRLEFAWGPANGALLKQVAYVELAITAGTGGRGSVWIDDLRLEERPIAAHTEAAPKVTASTSAPEHEPERILDEDLQTSWHSGALAADQWLLIDFLATRDYGGLVIDWDADDYATSYRVEVSNDAESWTAVYTGTHGNGGRDYIYLPDGESRYIRLQLQASSRGQGYGIRTLEVKPFSFSASPNQFFQALASDAPAGRWPKYFSGKQTYWTIVGVNGDPKEALLNEEGMLEVEKGAFSIEPFLYVDGTLLTWNAVRLSQELASGYLPIPTVTWQHDELALKITAFAAGKPGGSILYGRYRVANTGHEHRAFTLFLAIRPLQVLPPWQSLNLVGGVTPIRDLAFDARTVWVNHEKAVMSLTPPDRFGAATFEEGSVTDFLARDTVPPRAQVSDGFGYASGALEYRMDLAPGAHEEVHLAIPFYNSDVISSDRRALDVSAQLDNAIRDWEKQLGHVDLQLPADAARITRTVKSTLAYILINRDRAAIQPGSRNYARSWIRDGAMTSAALLEMGSTEEVRAFIRWFAQYQYPDGKVPCCVDRRGADPVPEHDSNGEFIYAIAEYYRFTRDAGFLSEMWPAVVKAVDYIATLRRQRLTDAFKRPEKQAFYGLLPESISHEGYSGHPVHSYWDDFFALRGLKDAASLATVVGDEERAASFAALRDAFRTDLYASLAKTMAMHKIDYIPGSVELGDFDATSTAIAVTLGSEQAHLPEPALTRTFDMYYANVQERQRIGPEGDDGYTPYELRNVGALVRLGQRERAFEILNLLLDGQRPAAWNEWAEVVWRDATAPKFIGDMPHTWVGSSFLQSVRTMLAYERDADRALVIAAGLPSAWVMSDAGVAVKRLPTYYGVLSYSLRAEGTNLLRLKLSGDLNLPPGNIVVQPPLLQPLKAVTVNGHPVQTFTADSATISEFPADVLLEYGPREESTPPDEPATPVPQ